ncbi:hypothetical protein [Terracoccus sp. 273MFTsu3.1]|uniref:hypothetical protein n=1 Tax=Terracoccus sp. 273MFTsu3.1 TaxID=1172188 RepID=UPI00035EF02F|nr:hypothetical protein [Terracoccus sp. 273MFTsu3.1]
MTKTKHCSRCDTTKPIDEFYANKATADGVQTYCKACWKTYRSKRWHAGERESQYAWRRANIEKVCEYNRRAGIKYRAKKRAAATAKHID